MIPKNTLVRRSVAKHIKKEYDDLIKSPVKKIDVDEIQGNYHYRRRLNNNIKKRVTSLLTECTVEIDEMADLLQLLNDRAVLDGFELKDVISKMNELNEQYGSYTDKYTTTENIDIEDKGFIPYRVLGHKILGSKTAMVGEKYRED